MRYFISGHLDITAEEFATHYVPFLEAAQDQHASFVVGDARGTDTLAQTWLSRFAPQAPVTVFHMFDNPRNNVAGSPTRGGFITDDERDSAMTKASDQDIAWVRPGREKSGTARNLARRKTHG